MAGINRALGRALLPSLLRQNLSASQIIRDLRAIKVSYRRQDMLNDIREAKDRLSFGDDVIDFPREQPLPRRLMSEVDLRQARSFRVFGQAKIYNKDSDRVFYKEISFYNDEFLTKERAERRLYENWSDITGESPSELLEFNVTFVQHHSGYRY